MGHDKNEGNDEKKDDASESTEALSRDASESSFNMTEDDDDAHIELGPKISIREHLEKDKDDESLRRWKEQLLGGVDVNAVAEVEEPDVKILSLTIVSADRPDIVLEIPNSGLPKGHWFTLKEGSKYNLRFSFKVSNNIVCGLKYINTVWKTGLKGTLFCHCVFLRTINRSVKGSGIDKGKTVDSSKQMLGTFSPQAEPYIHVMTEETTPSGMFARGSYSAKTKFLDDDNKCYLELNYTFDIQKDWAK
ncbi:Rho GDP-dissociation inhibitor 1-like protein [Tanacetum coccineum]